MKLCLFCSISNFTYINFLNQFYRYARRSLNQFKSLEKAIEMCIQSLPDDLKKKFQDFALFVHDLNIKPEVIIIQ